MRGFINVLKPEGMSSARAVGAVKKKLCCPCGHMGTLDPMASGVLPVAIGKTSRLFDYLLDKKKEYVARFRFGFTTDTLDVTGKIVKADGFVPEERDIKDALGSFVGEIEQVPPKYSAKCVGGKRGYALARKGVDFELPPKKVFIERFELLGKSGKDEYVFKIICKGGTYIRSLARDLGEKLSALGVMSALRRTASGIFNEDNGVDLERFMSEDDIEKYIIPPDAAVDFPVLTLENGQAEKILNGVFEDYGFPDGTYRVYNGSDFWGIGKTKEGKLKINAYVR